MLRIAQCKVSIDDSRSLRQVAAVYLRVPEEEILNMKIHKKSIDARDKENLLYVYSLDVTLSQEKKVLKRMEKKGVSLVEEQTYRFPSLGTENQDRPVIIGFGPAGIFAAYELARQGLRPIVLERGKRISDRQKDVDRFWEEGILDPESNVQFGEGGAGTFSDGKLNTMVKDPSGRIRHVLETFVSFGADPSILYESKPHIGTDVLAKVIPAMRQTILEMGGEVLFESRCVDFITTNDRLIAVQYENQGEIREVAASRCVLAIGHSARDTFLQIHRKGISMEPKAFAVGFRMEHPQDMIQLSQYGPAGRKLPAAAYKLTAQTSGDRGVYSFCMCPGGRVVNASSEPGRLAVNGMSYRARDRRNANSAIVATIRPEDCIRWIREQKPETDTLFAGMEFQRMIERRAYQNGGGVVPVQLFEDYCCRRMSTQAGDILPDIGGAYTFAGVHDILPAELYDAVREGIISFGRKIKGFDRPDALLSGVESRTSSPVRIVRNESFQSSIEGIYPCGEGAGYAGGITSAAVDGIKTAERVLAAYSRC